MKSQFKTGCWTAAIATGLLFAGATNVHAQFRATNAASQPAAKTGAVNTNLYRSNLSRPVLQPKQAVNRTNRGAANGMFPGQGQPGTFSGMNQGAYPGMYQSGYPNMNQGGYNPGYYPGMMNPGGYYGGFPGY
jgi:hypothetical protein